MGLLSFSPSPRSGFVWVWVTRILPVMVLVVALGVQAAPVQAANCHWTGATNALWSEWSNWQFCGGVGSLPGPGDSVEIPNTGVLTEPLLDLPSVSIASLTLMGGHTLTLNGNTSLSVPALTIGYNSHLNLGGHTLNLPATTALTLDDDLASIDAGLLVIQTSTTISLFNNNAINASLKISAGTSTVSSLNGGQVAGPVIIDAGTILTVPFNASFTIAGPVTNHGLINGDGILVIHGNLNNYVIGTIEVDRLQLRCSAPQQLSGAGVWHSDMLEVFAGCHTDLANDMTWLMTNLAVDNNGTLDLGSHTLTLNTATNLSLTGAAALIEGSGALIFQAAVNLNINAGRINVPLIITSSGSQVTDVNNGALRDVTLQTGANLYVQTTAQTLQVIGLLTIQSGAALIGPGPLSFSGSALVNDGTISIPFTFVGGSQSASGNGSYTGNVMVYVATLALSGSPTINSLVVTAGGTLHLAGTATLNLVGSWSALIIAQGNFIQDDAAFVVYKGTSTQSVGDIAFKNLVIQNSAGVNVLSPMSVSGKLYLFNGIFNNAAAVLTISNSEIRRSAGSLSAAPAFTGNIDVVYDASIPITTGFELPVSPASVGTLQVKDSAGVNLASNLTVAGYLMLTNGFFNLQTHTLTITAPNWEKVTGNLVSPPTSTVAYNAPTAGQSIISMLYGNLALSGGKKFAYDGNIEVAGNLDLGAEVMVPAGSRIVLDNGASTSGSFDVFGQVTRYGPFTPLVLYSFGNPSVFVVFTSAGTRPTQMDVVLSKTTPTGLRLALPRTYAITASGGSGYSATMRLHYYPAELPGSVPAKALAIWRLAAGPQWVGLPVALYDASGWVHVDGVTSFTTFALAPNYKYVFLPQAKK